MSLQLALEHRRALVALSDLTDREFAAVWAHMQGSDAEAVRDALMEVVPALADRYGDMAGALAADFYEESRERAEARGRFVAEPAPLPGSSRYEALVRWGVDPLFRPEPDAAAARTLISGGLQRIVANVDRDTVRLSAVRDPAAEGWQRVARGDGCGFCRMLAGRGAVYSEATVDFASHDHCHCSATVAWKHEPKPVKEQFVPSSGNVSDADKARARAYIAEHY